MTRVALSPGQAEALLALVRTGSIELAASDLGISVYSLNNRLTAAREKLGAQHTTHAVALAWPELGDRYELPHRAGAVCQWIGRCTRPAHHRGHHDGFRAIGVAA